MVQPKYFVNKLPTQTKLLISAFQGPLAEKFYLSLFVVCSFRYGNPRPNLHFFSIYTSYTDPVPPSTKQYRTILTQYHLVSTSTTKYQLLLPYDAVSDWVYMGQFLQDGKRVWIMSQKIFLKLHCDQTVGFFQDFSTVLKSFCPADSKNTFVFILADVFAAISIPCEWIHSLRENSKEPILHTFWYDAYLIQYLFSYQRIQSYSNCDQTPCHSIIGEVLLTLQRIVWTLS